MDAARFDTLAKSLSVARSRRGALTGLLIGTLGLLRVTDTQDAAAKDCKKINDKAKRKKCLAKAKGTTTSDPVSPPPVSPSLPPSPTCAQTCTGCCDTSGVCQAGTT